MNTQEMVAQALTRSTWEDVWMIAHVRFDLLDPRTGLIRFYRTVGSHEIVFPAMRVFSTGVLLGPSFTEFVKWQHIVDRITGRESGWIKTEPPPLLEQHAPEPEARERDGYLSFDLALEQGAEDEEYEAALSPQTWLGRLKAKLTFGLKW
jgi:hypothetical protein